MNGCRAEILLLLIELETALKLIEQWEIRLPDDQELQSSEPFSIDRLSCGQWLQWILIPKLTNMVVGDQPLPTRIGVHYYVEEAMKTIVGYESIVEIVAQLDAVLTERV